MKTILLISACTLVASAQNIENRSMRLGSSPSPQARVRVPAALEESSPFEKTMAYKDLTIRPGKESDLRALVTIMENQECEKLTNLKAPLDAPDLLAAAILHGRNEKGQRAFVQVIEDSHTHQKLGFAIGEISGQVKPNEIARIQYYTLPKLWKNAQAKVAIEGLIKKLEQEGDIDRVQMITSPKNVDLQSILSAIGFERGSELHPSRFMDLQAANVPELQLFLMYQSDLKPAHRMTLELGDEAIEKKIYGFNEESFR